LAAQINQRLEQLYHNQKNTKILNPITHPK
jgi:hypothetical protein